MGMGWPVSRPDGAAACPAWLDPGAVLWGLAPGFQSASAWGRHNRRYSWGRGALGWAGGPAVS